MEFTVERGRLYFLQTRTAKRTPRAALKIAVDLVEEGLIGREEALKRLADVDLKAAVSRFDEPGECVATALWLRPASLAAVLVSRASMRRRRAPAASQRSSCGVRPPPPTSADLLSVQGILTAVGGRTAHAAVVAREMGKVCLVGCRALSIDVGRDVGRLGEKLLREGDFIALDGATGEVSLGLRRIVSEDPPETAIIQQWRKDAAGRSDGN